MQKLTVIIPTCNRPAMLREALASVARQSCLQSVEKVIVSENSETRDSEAVCGEFPILPISYLRQNPTLPAIEHFDSLRSHVQSPIVATLHDDDWWMVDHLQNSLLALEQYNCVASFSNFVEATSTRHPGNTSITSFRVWAVSGCDFSKHILVLDHVENFLISLLDSSVHYSTFVGYTEACWGAFNQVVKSQNRYDNDRTFPIYLGEIGKIAYITELGAGIRTHPGRDCAQPHHQENGWEKKAVTTGLIATLYPGLMILVAKKFNEEVLTKLTDDEVQILSNSIGGPQRVALIEKCGLNLPMPRRSDPVRRDTTSKWLRTKVAQFKHLAKQAIGLK